MNDWTKLILGEETSQTAPVCNGQVRDMLSDIFSLQSQIAERDKTILEQQAQIKNTLNLCADSSYMDCDVIENIFNQGRDLSALEAHDREVRIKCLEDAADKLRGNGFNVLYEIGLRDGSYLMAAEELEFMADELKEQS